MTTFRKQLLDMANDFFPEPTWNCGAEHPKPTEMERSAAAHMPIYLGNDLHAYCRDTVIEICNEKNGTSICLSPASFKRLFDYSTLLHRSGLYG